MNILCPFTMKVVDVHDFETFSGIFRGRAGHRRAMRIMKLLSIDQVNRVHEEYGAFSGPAFTSRLLDDIGVNYRVGNIEQLDALPKGAFITVSNHPYGGLDGIMTIDLMARLRPDYKFMVNEILARVKTLGEHFITVTPTDNRCKGITASSLNGIRETLHHLENGHPLGFFPSGAVSDFSLRDRRIRDRCWQESILHLIQSVRVPILPIRFFDRNSALFYFLGLIHWRIRLLRLPAEVFNKKGGEPRIGIGKLITVKEQETFNDPGRLGDFLRKAVYEMPLPTNFVSRNTLIMNWDETTTPQ
jgi:hypothetical protein